jgi:hypothetical protein
MVLSVARDQAAAGGAGNLAFDISGKKWVLLGISHADGKAHVSRRGTSHVSDGLLYDPLYKVVLHHNNSRWVKVARPEKKGLKILEAPVVKRNGK